VNLRLLLAVTMQVKEGNAGIFRAPAGFQRGGCRG
jgi:hypothetical protein